MIIEFAGLPGSGKSTAANRLVEDLREHGLAPRTALGGDASGPRTPRTRNLRANLRLASTLLANPVASYAFARGLSSSARSPAERWFAFRHVAVTMRDMREARRRDERGSVTVFAEGICQRAFMTFVDGRGTAHPKLIRRFVATAPRPDVVVLLRVAPSVALDRLRSRGHGALSYRFDGLTAHELEERLGAGQQLMFDAAGYLASAPSRPTRRFVVEADDLTVALERLRTDLLPVLLRASAPQR